MMQQLFKDKKRIKYGQRWQVETVFSMIKRRLTTATRARKRWQRARELALLVLTYNLALRLLKEGFYRAEPSLFPLFPNLLLITSEVFINSGIPSHTCEWLKKNEES